MYWKIESDKLETTTESQHNPDGKTFWMEGLVEAEFPETKSSLTVECVITERNNHSSVLFIKEYKSVRVWCKYCTFML